MNESQYVPRLKFSNVNDIGVFFILYELMKHNIGAASLTHIPMKEIKKFPYTLISKMGTGRKYCDYMRYKDLYSLYDMFKEFPDALGDMYSKSTEKTIDLKNFVSAESANKNTGPLNKLRKVYVRDIWNPNLKRTIELKTKVEKEFNNNDRFFSKMAEFYDYDTSVRSDMLISVIPKYQFMTSTGATHGVDRETQMSKLVLSYKEPCDSDEILNVAVHELGHHYYKRRLKEFEVTSESVFSLDYIIEDINYADLYINEAMAVTWQNLFDDYSSQTKNKPKSENHNYGFGKMNHRDTKAMNMIAPQMFNGSIITHLADYMTMDVFAALRKKERPNRENIAIDAVAKLYKTIPNLKEQFQLIKEKNK